MPNTDNNINNNNDKPWTRKELSMRIGFGELATAVIEQWVRDGRPSSDREAMEYWFSVKQTFDAKKSEVK